MAHTWYDSSGLEEWEHGMQGRGVQAWDATRLLQAWDIQGTPEL